MWEHIAPFLTLASLLITAGTKMTWTLVEVTAWRWLENNLQIYLYVFQEQVDNLESSVTKFPFFFYHRFSVVNRLTMCGWVLQEREMTKIAVLSPQFFQVCDFPCFIFLSLWQSNPRLQKIYRKINISTFPPDFLAESRIAVLELT